MPIVTSLLLSLAIAMGPRAVPPTTIGPELTLGPVALALVDVGVLPLFDPSVDNLRRPAERMDRTPVDSDSETASESEEDGDVLADGLQYVEPLHESLRAVSQTLNWVALVQLLSQHLPLLTPMQRC
jgi:hypothetical protein